MKPKPEINDRPGYRRWLAMQADADRPGVVTEAVSCMVCSALVAVPNVESHADWHCRLGQVIVE